MMKNKSMKIILISIVILAAIAVATAIYFKPTSPTTRVAIDTSDQPTLGNPRAKIQIVAFEDLKCFNCKRFNTTLFPTIKKRFIDTGKAKYTVINLAFIPGSIPAAKAARCMYDQNNDLFFSFVDYLYDHQPPEDQNWATIPTLLNFASHVKGVDAKRFEDCLINDPDTRSIQNNLKIAAKTMGDTITTPSVYINGLLVQPLTLEQIEKMIKAYEKN